MILYLHGFRSSPASFKARLLAQHVPAAEWLCPQLPPSPAQAVALAAGLIEAAAPQELCLIGSSLGGFYATWLAQRYGCRCVLLNPAVRPARLLHDQVGTGTQYHSAEPFVFLPEYVAQLEALEVAQISRPERYFLLAATGDEVLDWREMAQHYAGARQHIIQGSDHGISEFAAYLPQVLAFAREGR
ncbi:YqiA/YcfP family alpha/beta fold hydrolase [Massilia sp. W12]|uniref:YqiA/YcfP family alpha/beta fold hydrolase n=1 Tax=Massilia sp. W12 TaxID=3126507 RepID=UPI0030CF157B